MHKEFMRNEKIDIKVDLKMGIKKIHRIYDGFNKKIYRN